MPAAKERVASRISKAKGSGSPRAASGRSPGDSLAFSQETHFRLYSNNEHCFQPPSLCSFVQAAKGSSQLEARAGQWEWVARRTLSPAVGPGPSSQPPGSQGAGLVPLSLEPGLRSGLSGGAGPTMAATTTACSFPGALDSIPDPTGLLSHPGLCLRPLVSGTGAAAGALGPVSGPARRCPLTPAMGILSTDSQPLVLLHWHIPSAFLCLTRDQGGNSV